MKSSRIYCLFATSFLLGGLTQICWSEPMPEVTLDPVIITASHIKTPLSQVTSSVTIITAEDIEIKKGRDCVLFMSLNEDLAN